MTKQQFKIKGFTSRKNSINGNDKMKKYLGGEFEKPCSPKSDSDEMLPSQSSQLSPGVAKTPISGFVANNESNLGRNGKKDTIWTKVFVGGRC